MRQLFLVRLVLVIGLTLTSFYAVFAQQVDNQEWPKGRIVLTSGDTLFGPITYHRSEDIIRVTLANGSVQAFAPVNVSSFTVTDAQNRFSQTFRPYMWNHDNDYSDYLAPAFFEVLSEGEYALVKREELTTRNVNYGPMYAGAGRYYNPYGYGYGGPRSQTIVLDLFYVYTPKQQIRALRNPKRDLETLFGDKGKEMKQYIKTNKLEYDNARDLAVIIGQFNRLQ